MTSEKLLEFERDYYDGKYPNQRLGQAFCNNFNISNWEIFYEENDKTARFMIWQEFFLSQ